MTLSSLAGHPAPKDLLVDLAQLEQEYYTRWPDMAAPTQRVSFGTSGHRGSALSFGIQAMCLLAGAARARGKVQDFAFFFVVFDPAILMPPEEFKAQIRELIEAVRAVPPLDPDQPVRIPSERAFRERERRRKEGIPVDRAVYDQLRALIERAVKK